MSDDNDNSDSDSSSNSSDSNSSDSLDKDEIIISQQIARMAIQPSSDISIDPLLLQVSSLTTSQLSAYLL